MKARQRTFDGGKRLLWLDEEGEIDASTLEVIDRELDENLRCSYDHEKKRLIRSAQFPQGDGRIRVKYKVKEEDSDEENSD